MSTVTNNPLHMLEAHFKGRLEAGVNTSSVDELVSYIGKFIKEGATWVNEGVKHEFSPQMILEAAKNAFMAKQGKTEDAQQKALLMKGLNTLEKAFADKNLANVLQLSLEASAESYGIIRDSLIEIHSRVSQDKEGSPSVEQQRSLMQGLINQAEIAAHNYETKTTDPEIFARELSKSLNENISKLTHGGVKAMKESIDSLGLAVNSFALFEALPNSQNISGHLKYGDQVNGKAYEAEFKQGDFHSIKLGERKEVFNIFQDIVANYEANISSGKMTEEQALAQAHSKLLPQLGSLKDEQIAYFKHLSSQYTELKTKQPDEWLSHLTQSLPGLVLPSIMGAVIAYVFGLSAELGAIGFAALSFLSGQSSSDQITTAKPPRRGTYEASDKLATAAA